jgi:putative acetyltransferase
MAKKMCVDFGRYDAGGRVGFAVGQSVTILTLSQLYRCGAVAGKVTGGGHMLRGDLARATLVDVDSGPRLEHIRALFVEYARSLNFSLCFQQFDQELRELPGEYAPPHGRLILCEADHRPAGCVALKKLEARICEMKRLYVRPEFRGRDLGLKLVTHLIAEARSEGYSSMRLDTVSGIMDHAIALYRSVGFRDIPAYYASPVANAVYLELDLLRSSRHLQ